MFHDPLLSVMSIKTPVKLRYASIFCNSLVVSLCGISWLQAGVGLLRFNCAKAAFNGASKLVVTPLGRWKLSIVLISFYIAWVGVRVVDLCREKEYFF